MTIYLNGFVVVLTSLAEIIKVRAVGRKEEEAPELPLKIDDELGEANVREALTELCINPLSR